MTLYDDGPFAWMNHIACKDMDPEIFHPNSSGVKSQRQIREAERVCAGCPVQAQCNQYKKRFGGVTGVWGGEATISKNAIGTSGGGPQTGGSMHGTPAAAMRHRRRGEKPCQACLLAENRARAARGW